MLLCSFLGFLDVAIELVMLRVEDEHRGLRFVVWMEIKPDCVDLMMFR